MMSAINFKGKFFVSGLFAVLLMAACYQRLQRLDVKATDEGIVFSHPKMQQAFDQTNLCVFGEISVSRQNSQGTSEVLWSVQNTESGFQPSTLPMSKPFIIYGENLPQMSVKVNPQLLSEGKYRVNGVVGIYNEKRELLDDVSFADDFVLKREDSGKLIVEK